MKSYISLENAFSVADEKSFAEVQDGVFVQSKESLLLEQKTWGDEDEAKNIDFSLYDYWLVCDDGQDPQGILDLNDLKKMVK